MKKRLLNLIMAVVAMMGCWGSAFAQTDVTSTYLTNGDFSSIDGWTIEVDHVGESYGGTYYKLDTGLDPKCIEVYHTWAGSSAPLGQTKNFKFSQTPTLPAGEYRLIVNGFYREGAQQNATTDKAWMFAGEKTQYLVGIGTCGANNMGDASNVFRNGGCKNEFDFTVTEEGPIEIGFQGFINTSLSWVILGPVQLLQYSMDDFNAELEAARTKLDNLDESTLNAAMNDKINAVLSETATVNQTKTDILEATAKVNAVYEEAIATQGIIAKVIEAMSGCYDLMDATSSTGDVEALEAAIIKAEEDIFTAEDPAAVVDTIVAELNAAKMVYITTVELGEGETIDMSWLVVNPGFDTNLSGWTSEGGAQNKAHASNKTNGIITGGFFENWNPSPFTGTIYQVINGLPNGKYKVKVAAFGNGAHVFANDTQVQMTSDDGTWYEVETMVSNGTLKFGIVNNNNTGWMGIDNASIAFAGTVDLSELQATLAEKLVEAEAIDQTTAMNAEALAALTTAIANAKNVAETEEALTTALADLTTAINVANSSITDYANLKKALDKAAEILASTNVYVEADKVAYETVYNEAKAAYEAGTYVADANTINKLWNTGYKDGNLLARPFISSVWSEDDAVYTNNWSVEADNKANGSGMTVPFVEYWTGDANSLGAKTIDTTIEGLEAGMYKVTALVRVRLKNNAASSDNITFSANDASIEVCDGKVCEDGAQFRYDNYRLIATVAEDGVLTIAFNVADGNNVSWLSFKNVNYAPVSDEELAEIEKEQAAAKLAAAKEMLYTAGNKVATLNAIINDEAVATILTEAQAMYENEAATLDEVTAKTAEVYNALNSYANDALLNGSFETSTEGAIDNWTQVKEGQYTYSGIAAYGSETLVNSASAPATNIIGGEGTALGISAAWQSKMSFTQDVTLPAGKYILSYEAYNSNPTASLATNLTGVSVGETSFNSSLTSYEGLAWTNDAIEFELTEESAVTVTLGYISNNIGSGTTPKLWIDNVAIYLVEAYAPAKVPSSLEPVNGAEVGMLTKIEAKFDFEIDKNWEATEMPVVKNSNGETVYTLESYQVYLNDTWDGVVFEMPEVIMTPDTYTITVPAGLINEVDAEGNPTGETNDAFEVTYVVTGEFAPVAEDFVPTACDPEDGATINQLYSFNLTFAEAPQVNYEVENPVTVYNEDGDVISTGSVFGSRMPNAVTVACNNMGESITAGGTYTIVIAAGAIGNELWLNTGGVTGSCNPEMTYTFTVVEPDLNPTAIVPDNNSEVEKIESITLTYEFAVGLNWSVAEKITVKDAEGNVVAEADGDACEEIRPEGANFWDPCYTIKVNFATPVTAKGTYTVNIPAEFLFMGEAGEFKSKATELTYTVNGGENISNIFAEDGNVTVYTVTGVKVMDNQPVSELKNLKKGIYIINGKTMVIK
jgi:hypothetical protein